MKAELVGNKKRGFSTLEIMIAFAIVSIVLVGCISANFLAQYWTVAGQTSNEGLYKAKTKLEDLRALIKQDFYSASSSPLTASVDPADPVDASCINGGLCYFVQTTITDISSCSKYVLAHVEWQIDRYPKTHTALSTHLTNSNEIINRGGDCILNVPEGDWRNHAAQSVGLFTHTPGKLFTSIDVLHKKIYAGSELSPSFLVYDTPTAVGTNPNLTGTLDIKLYGVSQRINAVDVQEDLSTGRKYAFAAVHASSSQLAVIDVTDGNNPALVNQATLQGVSGSYPEGYRLYIYGGRLYMTTRETAGNELHIFDISTPTLPTEIGSGFALNRTVNDIIVRDQKVGSVTKRFAFIAADLDGKELAVLDVTNDSAPVEVNSVDLPGNQDGLSLYVVGQKLYFGRASTPSGPELYAFDIEKPATTLPTLGQGEVAADVSTIKVFGGYAYLGTSRNNEELQVWNSDVSSWNAATLNSGRWRTYNMSNLAQQGFDVDGNWIYAISRASASDKIQVLYATP